MNELNKQIADIILGYTFDNHSTNGRTEFDPDDLPDMTTDIINCVNDNNRPMTFVDVWKEKSLSSHLTKLSK
jgi:hypothetical protein